MWRLDGAAWTDLPRSSSVSTKADCTMPAQVCKGLMQDSVLSDMSHIRPVPMLAALASRIARYSLPSNSALAPRYGLLFGLALRVVLLQPLPSEQSFATNMLT